MKKILLSLSIVLVISELSAQMPLFPAHQGEVLLYHLKNGKGVMQSQQRTLVKKVSGAPEKMTIEYEVENLDEKGKSDNPPVVVRDVVVSNNGIIDVDIAKILATNKGMEKAKVEVSGEGFKLTPDIKVGQRAGNTNVNISLGIVKIKAIVSDTQCTAIENITVGAGTFRAFKIEQTITAAVLGIKNITRTVTWYAEGIGAVKAINYDKKGTVILTKELVEIK